MTQPAIWSAAPVPSAVGRLEACGLPGPVAVLLARRGVSSPEEATRFLNPSASDLRAPREIAGLAPVVARLEEARRRGEKVAIVGDYDADGVTATALLTTVLRSSGIATETILPDRFREGYGFQPAHAETAARAGCGLLVTVDCGIGSHAAVDRANQLGIEVVITDHHLPAACLPSAVAVLDPHLDGPDAPGQELTGVGLALKVGVALLEELGREVPLEALLRVACIGTIADVAPLLGENRAIAALGLAALPGSRSVGLRALLAIAQVRSPVRADDVAFRLAPRLNAAGRLASADLALELLCTRNAARASELALRLDRLNRERQGLELQAVEEARRAFADRPGDRGILVGWSETWHPGVVGIAAGRLARELNRPVVLLARQDGIATGSGRSVPGIDLHGFLEPWGARLLRFGGHAQAIGLSIATQDLLSLRDEWETHAAAWPADRLRRRQEYEIELTPSELTAELLGLVSRLAPHGPGNPEPAIRMGPLLPSSSPRPFGNGHLELRAVDPRRRAEIELVGWGWAARREVFSGEFEIVACLRFDDKGGPRLAARILDARAVAAGVQEPRQDVESGR